MKRDLDLIRSLLETFEAMPPGEMIRSFSLSSEHDSLTVLSHVELMCQSGLLDGNCRPKLQSVHIKGITWAGHDFLDAARDPGVWNKTKDRLKSAGSWTFELVLEVLKEEAKKQLSGILPG